MQSISIFEMIKVGIGPSSSHTMGPWNAAEMFLNSLNISEVEEVFVEFFGSLAKTGIGHGTDIAAMMGLSGEDFRTVDTDRIFAEISKIKSEQRLLLGGKKEIPFIYGEHLVLNREKTLDFHPNGMIFRAVLSNGKEISQDYYSVGGGFVATRSDTAKMNEIRTPYPCHKGKDVPYFCNLLKIKRMSDLVFINEEAWRSREDTRREALFIWKNIRESVYRGISKEGVLPGGLNVARRAAAINKKLLKGKNYQNINEWLYLLKNSQRNFNEVTQWISCFALAVNEENASFGRIVTAPTNGASGVLPATLMYAHCFTDCNAEDDVVRFLLTAGEIGTLFKKNATISAAMGGCQAEIGVSSAMAAAGLTEIFGGTPAQTLMAAEIAMEHHLGLTCDPIAGLVQIPCIERNSMGAVKAITAAYLALDSDPQKAKVSLDEVISSMWETALGMNSKYKETSEGGLAVAVNVAEC